MSYLGDVTSHQAYEALWGDTDAVLVDVRTRPEWQFAGVPVVDRIHFVEWTTYPDGSPNPHFLDELAQAGVSADTSLYFICRSGQRSAAAAHSATAAGYGHAYNISDGFEGPPDESGQRKVSGWKNHGLPWRQT